MTTLEELQKNRDKGTTLADLQAGREPLIAEGPTFLSPEVKQFTGDVKKAFTVENALREGLPIAGDIAATALAPQFAIPAKIATKGGKLVGIGRHVANAISRSLAAGGGAVAGEVAGQQITGEEPDPEDIERQFLAGAGGEAAISGLSVLRGPAGFLARTGLRFIGGATVSGQALKQHYREQLVNSTAMRAEKFLDDMFPGASKEQVGLDVGKFFMQKKDFSEVYKGYNEIVDEALELTDKAIPVPEVRELILSKAKEMFPGKSDLAAVSKFRSWLGYGPKSQAGAVVHHIVNRGVLGPRDSHYGIQAVWNSPKTDLDEVTGFKDVLKSTWLKEVEGLVPKAAQAKIESDAIFKEVTAWFDNNPTIKAKLNKTFGGERYFEKFSRNTVDDLWKTASPAELQRIKKEMQSTVEGAKAWAGLEFHWIKNMYDKSLTRDMKTDELMFAPANLSREIYKDQEKWMAVSPMAWMNLKKEADAYMEIAPELKRMRKAETIPYFALRGLGGAMGFGAHGVAGVAGVELAGAASAWALMSPTSRKLVHKMVNPAKAVGGPAAKAAAHLGREKVMPRKSKKKSRPQFRNVDNLIDLMNRPKN